MEESADYPSPSFRLIAVVALCIGIGAGAWAFFALIIPSISDDGKTVYIQADKSPIKTTPDQPGGMDIPHQDKLVFNAVTPGSKPVSEHLAPPPEQPMYGATPPAAPATPATAAPTVAPVAAAPGTAAAAVQPGQTDAPGQGSGPQRKLTMPVALGRAIDPAAAGAPGTPPAPIAATQAVKAVEPAASFEFKDGGAPPIPKAAEPVVAKAQPGPKGPEKLIADSEILLSQDPNAPRTTPDTGSAPIASAVTAPSTDDKPILPPAQKVAAADTTTADDSDGTDDAVDDTMTNAEDASPLNARKSKSSASSASKPEDEAVTYKPSPAGAARYQLASYTDRASAQRAVSSFTSKYSGMIAKSSLTVVGGQANGHQVYRVQGSAASKDEAASICGRVKAKGGSCVTVR